MPKGTILYRAADSLENYTQNRIAHQENLCSDTDKRGLYFSTYPFLSMAISTEYKRDMLLGVFLVTEDIEAADGKYTFRELIIPNFSTMSNEDQIKNLSRIPSPLPEFANINNFDCEILPLLVEKDKNILPDEFIDRSINSGYWKDAWLGEVFLAKANDRAKLLLYNSYIILYKEVNEIASQMDWYATINIDNQKEWLTHLKKYIIKDSDSKSQIKGGKNKKAKM